MSEAVNLKVPIKDCLTIAIFNLDLDMVKRLLETKAYDKSVFDDVCLIDGHHCPVNWIPQLWDVIIDNPESWSEGFRAKIGIKKKANHEIKRILVDEMDIDFTPIEFSNNDLWIYQWFAEMSFEEFYDCTKQELVNRGHKEIDIDLYYSVNQYNFEESKRLLQLGANPYYTIPEEGGCCFDLIEERCDFYDHELSHILLQDHSQNSLDYRDLANLLAWGANKMMFNLLCASASVDAFHHREIK